MLEKDSNVSYNIKMVLLRIIFIYASTGIKHLQHTVVGRLDKTVILTGITLQIKVLYADPVVSGHKTLCRQPHGSILRLFKRIDALAV